MIAHSMKRRRTGRWTSHASPVGVSGGAWKQHTIRKGWAAERLPTGFEYQSGIAFTAQSIVYQLCDYIFEGVFMQDTVGDISRWMRTRKYCLGVEKLSRSLIRTRERSKYSNPIVMIFSLNKSPITCDTVQCMSSMGLHDLPSRAGPVNTANIDMLVSSKAAPRHGGALQDDVFSSASIQPASSQHYSLVRTIEIIVVTNHKTASNHSYRNLTALPKRQLINGVAGYRQSARDLGVSFSGSCCIYSVRVPVFYNCRGGNLDWIAAAAAGSSIKTTNARGFYITCF